MESILYFAQKDEQGAAIYIDDVLQIKTPNQQGQRESLATLQSMILEGRPEKALNKFFVHVANELNWQTFERWQELKSAYEQAMLEHEAYLLNPTLDNNGEVVARPEPVAPQALSFTPVTPEDVKAMVKDELATKAKVDGTEYQGQFISLTEENQLGLSSIRAMLKDAAEIGQNVYPQNIHLSGPSGKVIYEIADYADFQALWVHFGLARQAFF